MPTTFQLHEFARRVLYATTLEEKLTGPGVGARLIDDERGSAIVGTTIPGRPADLRMRRDGVRANFPSKASLIDEEQRAVLMHFFANHELIAVELMALVLLKFPDAPKRFRLGVYQTLREEQMHARWYVNRMSECGVNFGDFPVSNLIWNQIAPMASPLDYVSRLSLTFEQANLDYSKFYAGVLHNAGDTKTAKILAQIYRDEINHVGYGLHWFRKKNRAVIGRNSAPVSCSHFHPSGRKPWSPCPSMPKGAAPQDSMTISSTTSKSSRCRADAPPMFFSSTPAVNWIAYPTAQNPPQLSTP